jgi:hypothetical protein
MNIWLGNFERRQVRIFKSYKNTIEKSDLPNSDMLTQSVALTGLDALVCLTRPELLVASNAPELGFAPIPPEVVLASLLPGIVA